MTKINTQNILSDFWSRRWLRIQNTEQRTIPPFAALEIIGNQFDAVSGEMIFLVRRPLQASLQHVCINSFDTIGPLNYGAATMDYPCIGLCSGSPAVGDVYGTTPNSYWLKAGNEGFQVLGIDGGHAVIHRHTCCPLGSSSSSKSVSAASSSSSSSSSSSGSNLVLCDDPEASAAYCWDSNLFTGFTSGTGTAVEGTHPDALGTDKHIWTLTSPSAGNYGWSSVSGASWSAGTYDVYLRGTTDYVGSRAWVWFTGMEPPTGLYQGVCYPLGSLIVGHCFCLEHGVCAGGGPTTSGGWSYFGQATLDDQSGDGEVAVWARSLLHTSVQQIKFDRLVLVGPLLLGPTPSGASLSAGRQLPPPLVATWTDGRWLGAAEPLEAGTYEGQKMQLNRATGEWFEIL